MLHLDVKSWLKLSWPQFNFFQQPKGVFKVKQRKHVVAATAATTILLMWPIASHAIDPAYAKKLDRSGCTQVTELKGCDINKTKAENAKAGFAVAPPATSSPTASTYTGQWVAKNAGTGKTVATIRVDGNNKVWVNGKPVAGKLSDGALVFKTGLITFTIQGDPRVVKESSWTDFDAKTTGPIRRPDQGLIPMISRGLAPAVSVLIQVVS
ncbi:hypothetical protein [Cyanobium sp. Morenito 9A2]|uniref:hypothetical protein n=1 Tax=Cyanobium sp. Morenito 9A2 TaxID=2823718 RepID=UPI0020CC2464|nr:hypothetical protein [Cyanobium sp. Morenito 9A2]MCP9850203.1 hypothetical protein [Cyanobium sp. Morenito 9A2]